MVLLQAGDDRRRRQTGRDEDGDGRGQLVEVGPAGQRRSGRGRRGRRDARGRVGRVGELGLRLEQRRLLLLLRRVEALQVLEQLRDRDLLERPWPAQRRLATPKDALVRYL